MDNLLAKTIKFFFVPEATLAVFFLIVFVALFGVGIYWVRNCRQSIENLRDNSETEYELVRAKMSPNLFIKKYLIKISSTESKLEGVPEAFVSIGIVATFLGLGVAIQGSAELLENEKLELAKLTAVLGVIAFKFQTSVWGICFSLIFRSVIADKYFDFRQKTIDYVSDLLYKIERDSIRTLIEKQNNFLTTQQDWRVKAESDRAELLKTQHKNLIAENRQLFAALFKMLTEHQNFLANNFNTFIKAAETFTESTKQFSDRVDQFKVELTNTLQYGFKKIKLGNENLGVLHEKHIQEIHSTQERNIFYVTEKLDELHQKFYLDAKKYVEDTQFSLDNLIEKTLDKIHDGYIREAAEIRSTVSQLNDTLSTIESRVNLTNKEFIRRQNQFVNEWRGVTESVVDTLQKVASTVNENSAKVIQTYNNLQTITTDIQKLVADNSKNLTNITLETSRYFDTALEKFSASQKNIHSDIAETLKQILKRQEENFALSNNLLTTPSDSVNIARSTINTLRPDRKRK